MFKVNVQKQEGFDEKSSMLLAEGVFIWQKVMNSQQFKDRILGFSYVEKTVTGSLWWKKVTTKVYNHFNWNYVEARGIKAMTNQEIYDYVMKGSEILQPGNDGEADIQITLYAQPTSTIGYTYPTTTMQWINYKFFKAFQAWNVSGNLSHEWLHKLGFGHAQKDHATRKYTVPYAIGYIVEELAEQFSNYPSTWKLVDAEQFIASKEASHDEI